MTWEPVGPDLSVPGRLGSLSGWIHAGFGYNNAPGGTLVLTPEGLHDTFGTGETGTSLLCHNDLLAGGQQPGERYLARFLVVPTGGRVRASQAFTTSGAWSVGEEPQWVSVEFVQGNAYLGVETDRNPQGSVLVKALVIQRMVDVPGGGDKGLPVVLLNGQPLDPFTVLVPMGVTVGRSEPSVQPEANAADLSLLGTPQVKRGDTLEVWDKGRARFTGTVSDLSTTLVQGRLSTKVQGIGRKAALGGILVGDAPWPVETEAARVAKIVAALPPGAPTVTVDGSEILRLRARDVDRQPVLDLLHEVAESTGALVWEDTSGVIHHERARAREGDRPEVRVTEWQILDGVEWSKPAGSVIGTVEVEYGPEPLDLPLSEDEGNAATVGSDGGLYVPASSGSGGISVPAASIYSTTTHDITATAWASLPTPLVVTLAKPLPVGTRVLVTLHAWLQAATGGTSGDVRASVECSGGAVLAAGSPVGHTLYTMYPHYEQGEVSLLVTITDDTQPLRVEVKAQQAGGTGGTSRRVNYPGLSVVPLGPVTDAAGGPLPTPWTPLVLENGWTNYAGGYAEAAYRKVGDVVELRGLVRNGTGNIATLPVGFRPPGTLILSGITSSVSTTSGPASAGTAHTHAVVPTNTMARIDVTSAGVVNAPNGSTNWVSLSEVRFSVSA